MDINIKEWDIINTEDFIKDYKNNLDQYLKNPKPIYKIVWVSKDL